MNRTSCNAYGNRTQTCPGRPNYCTPPQNRPVPPKYSLDLRNMNQEQLLAYINQVSFVVSDMLLYLDTHPCDEAALSYFMEHKNRRVAALKEYAKYYGPLTIDTADDEASESFLWVETPWPWEGGGC